MYLPMKLTDESYAILYDLGLFELAMRVLVLTLSGLVSLAMYLLLTYVFYNLPIFTYINLLLNAYHSCAQISHGVNDLIKVKASIENIESFFKTRLSWRKHRLDSVVKRALRADMSIDIPQGMNKYSDR